MVKDYQMAPDDSCLLTWCICAHKMSSPSLCSSSHLVYPSFMTEGLYFGHVMLQIKTCSKNMMFLPLHKPMRPVWPLRKLANTYQFRMRLHELPEHSHLLSFLWRRSQGLCLGRWKKLSCPLHFSVIVSSWTESRWSHEYQEPGVEKPIRQLCCWETW